MVFWDSLAFSMIQQMLGLDLWLLCLFKIHLVHLEVVILLEVHILLKPTLKDFEYYLASM